MELLPLRETLHSQNVERVQTGVVGNVRKDLVWENHRPRAHLSHVRALTAAHNAEDDSCLKKYDFQPVSVFSLTRV